MVNEQRPKRRIGCIVFPLLVVGAIAAAVWKLSVPTGPGAAAKEVIAAPVDPVASAAVTTAFTEGGISGVNAAVVPLPDGTGNAALVVLDTAAGFKPVTGGAGKRQQALDVIKRLVEANTKDNLNLQRIGLEYREEGRPIIALTAPMDALAGVAGQQMTDEQFLARVDVKLKDRKYMMDLVRQTGE